MDNKIAASTHRGREGGLPTESISDAKSISGCLMCQTGAVASNQSRGCRRPPPLVLGSSLVSLGQEPCSLPHWCVGREGRSFLKCFLHSLLKNAGEQKRKTVLKHLDDMDGVQVFSSGSQLFRPLPARGSVPVPYPPSFTGIPTSNAP